ncbi:MAG: CotH kinase family protein, partial [Bacteroidota bacterium]|nr:CotH kinase family protein [Bacteroidota bacterium]
PCVFYVNGQYWGVYDVREKVDDHDFTRINYGQDKFDLQMIKTWGGTWSEYGGGQAQNDWDALVNYIESNDMGDPAAFAYVDGQFNWKSLIDYFCLNSYTVCSDWLNWNTAWWRGMNPAGEGTKWRYLLWDMDATFDHYANFTGIPDESVNADPCDADELDDPGGQGHTVILNKLIEENQMVHDYYVNRYADLGNTVFSCDFMLPFLDEMVAAIAPEMPGQVARWGGTVAEWEANVLEMREFIEERCITIQEGMVDCYDLVGPFEVCFNVDPPLSGEININSITPEEFPFCGLYYGNIATTLAPVPEEGFVFGYWEVFSSNTISPTITDSLVTIDFLTADSVVAHFVPDIQYEVIFNVDPPLSGTIWIDGFIPPTYTYIDTVNSGTIIEMAPIPESGWLFAYWEIFSANELLPSTTDSLVTIEILEDDSIVAHFVPAVNWDIVFNVDPPLSGSISIDGFIPGTYPYTDSYGDSLFIELAPLPAASWIFSFWEVFSTNVMLPSTMDSLVTMQVVAVDSIVAHFEPANRYDITLDMVPRDGGEIVFEGTTYQDFPAVVNVPEGLDMEFKVVPKMYYDFLYWTVLHNEYLPDDSSATDLTARFYSTDTVTAWLDPQEYVYYTPNSFTPNGDGINDVFFPINNVIDLESYDLNIYDRWGQVIFKSTDPYEGWDGTSAGGDLPIGVYVFRAFMVDANLDDRYEIFGHVTLIR